MSLLSTMSTPSSHPSPPTCVLAGRALRATSPSPQEGKAGGAMEWETTSTRMVSMDSTSGQVSGRNTILRLCVIILKISGYPGRQPGCVETG